MAEEPLLQIQLPEDETPAQVQEKRERNTELWGKCVIQAMLLINATYGIGIEIDDELAISLVAGIESVYTIGRSIKKRGAAVDATAARTTASRAAQTNALVGAIVAAITKQQQQINQQPTAPAASPVTVNFDTKTKETPTP